MVNQTQRLEEAKAVVSLHQPFFTAMIHYLKPIEDETTPTMGTDGEYLYYNPKFMETLPDDELCGVVLHETLHCAFRHIWREKNRDHFLWNCATDYAINLVVTETFPLPKGALISKKYRNMDAEEIYDSFPKKKGSSGGEGKDGKSGDQQKKGQGGGQGKKQEGDSQQPWGDHERWGEDDENQGKGGNGSLIDKLTGKKTLPKKTKSNSEKEEAWRRMYEKSLVRNYGTLPESMKRLMEKSFYEPKLDWSALVSPLLSEDTIDYSFSVPDRRFLDTNYILPDMYSLDKLKDVVFAFDTSGSIGEDDLNAYYMETLALFQNYSSLQGWIAVCDAALHSFEEVDAQRSFMDFHFVGGGGTDFRPVFKEIEKRGIHPKAVFYFTDTEGSFPAQDPGYPVFWLVRGGRSGWGGRVPFGQVIEFEHKETT